MDLSVNYAAAVVLEIRQPSFNHYNIDTNSDALPIPLEPVIRFKFKNGSDDSGFTSYPMTFKGWDGRHHKGEDVPLSTFIKAFEGVVVNNKFEWCRVCGQRSERGCKDFFCPGFPVSTDITDSKQMPPLNWGIVGQVEEVGGRGLNVILVAVVFGLFALLLVKWSKKSGWRQNGAEIHMMVCLAQCDLTPDADGAEL